MTGLTAGRILLTDTELVLIAPAEVPIGDATVVAAMRGEREAILALWHEHRRWIAAVLLAHKSPHDPLDDLLQEVAMTLVSKISSLREPRNIRAWLRTVAVNTARASARAWKSRPRPGALDIDYDCGASTAEAGDLIALDDEARRLLALASRIPEAYREPLMLRAVHGMRGRHIAEILSLPEATVETRIARARRMLRELAVKSTEIGPRPAIVASIAGHNVQRGER
ncbi:MAG: RNA polymerase sigma factor [Planctomycetes bacterium]|nr:RNA polymerase sigma factor [Planctomycetota bacterium]